MPLDLNRAGVIVDGYYGNLPHPAAPKVKLKEYAAFERAAKTVKGGGDVTGNDVAHIHETLTNLDISPSDLEKTWRVAQPISKALLGRDPHFEEVKDLAGQHPSEYHDYFGHQPHPMYPEVKAMDMMKYQHVAEPIARRLAQRLPIEKELARFALGSYSSEDIVTHYSGEW